MKKIFGSLLVIATLLFINVAFSCDPPPEIIILENVYPGIHKKYQVVKDKTRYNGCCSPIIYAQIGNYYISNFLDYNNKESVIVTYEGMKQFHKAKNDQFWIDLLGIAYYSLITNSPFNVKLSEVRAEGMEIGKKILQQQNPEGPQSEFMYKGLKVITIAHHSMGEKDKPAGDWPNGAIAVKFQK